MTVKVPGVPSFSIFSWLHREGVDEPAYDRGMDAVAFLDRLLGLGVNALLRVDAERVARPWTFHAIGGPLDDGVVRVDAGSAEECLHRARKALRKAGLVLDDVS